MTICGVLLLNKNNELIVWTRSGGIYSIAEQCRGAIDRKRVGEWIDFEIENGFVESLTSRDRTVSGGRATRLRGDKVQFLGSIKIPTEEESNKIGWTEPAVHCTFLGKVCTSYQFIWTLRSYDLSLGHECWVDWDPKTERFNLAAQTVVEAKHTKFFEKAYIPWDLENTTELGWKSGILMARTNFSSFVATEYGDFILTAHSERIGDKPPVIGCYLKCKLRSHKAKLSDQNVGEVLAYEVLPMPDDCEVHSLPLNGAFCVLRCRAKVLRFQETRDKRAILFNSTLYACHDTESLIRNPKIGVYYDVIVRRPKDEELIQCDQGWKIVKVMGELEGYEERQNLRAQDFDREEEMGRRKATSQFKRQEAKNDDDSLTHELRGIVMNQAKGYNFISFSNDKEAAYHRKDTRSKGFQELELGGHVCCLVRDMQSCSENETPRCEILSYQTIPSPAGWGVAGTTDAGLARIICPLRFLHMSQGRSGRPYPIYQNELMEKVHDYDRRTIGFGEKLDLELLKRLKVKAEVIRSRVPEWRGRNGLLVHVLLEKEIVDLDDDWLQQGRIVEELESERNSVPNESNDRFATKSQKQELRGIVMNQAKGMNFIFLSNQMEASYSMRDATRNNAPMKLGDHLECVISDVLTFDDVKKRTKCEILSYRIVPTPTGWGFEGQTPAGLAKISCPLRFLRLMPQSSNFFHTDYPVYCNDFMEAVHDYDRLSIDRNKKPNVDELKSVKLVAVVVRTRIPGGGGRIGLILTGVLEKHIETRSDDTDWTSEETSTCKSQPQPSRNQTFSHPTGNDDEYWVKHQELVQDKKQDFDPTHRHQNDRLEPLAMEKRGIVINQAKGYNFILFDDNLIGTYHMRDVRLNGLPPLKLGDHLFCEVGDMKNRYKEARPEYKVLNYRLMSMPSGWGFQGQTESGLARISCPLWFHGLSDQPPKGKRFCYPIYGNEFMEMVHDYDQRTVNAEEKPNIQALKSMKLIGEVVATRLPNTGGLPGILLQQILERHVEANASNQFYESVDERIDDYPKIEQRDPQPKYQFEGYVLKKWGFFLVIWVTDNRLAVIDTRSFAKNDVPELGSIIECDIVAMDAPILDQKMIYKWDVIAMGRFRRNSRDSIVDTEKSIVFCRELIFESYRLVNGKPIAHFSHPFFGLIYDKQGVFKAFPQPGDLIDSYIQAIPDGESSLQWAIADPEDNEKSLLKLPPRAIVAPLNYIRIVDDDDEDEGNEWESFSNAFSLSKISETAHIGRGIDAQSTSTYGTNEEIEQITSSTSGRTTGKESNQTPIERRAKSYEELLTTIVNHPEIAQVVYKVNPDLFAECLSLNM